MNNKEVSLAVVVPAAGVGKRMQAACPKQYLKIQDHTILEHTVLRLASHSCIKLIVIPLSPGDEYFSDSNLAQHPKVQMVDGGKERVDSVLCGLNAIDEAKYPWVLVHDAARPCVTLADIQKLIDRCLENNCGGILATPVRDTMKRANQGLIAQTVEREQLWHALTPQMFQTPKLKEAITTALDSKATVTDEASAIEFVQEQCQIIEGQSDNIKITRPDDLALAEFILTKQQAFAKEHDNLEQA